MNQASGQQYTIDLPDPYKTLCTTPPPGIKIMAGEMAVPLIVGALNILVNETFGSIGGYVEQEKKKFSRTYSARVNTDNFVSVVKNRRGVSISSAL